jgi:hypothetical protein
MEATIFKLSSSSGSRPVSRRGKVYKTHTGRQFQTRILQQAPALPECYHEDARQDIFAASDR